MKNKTGMAKLRKKIVITFILITFVCGIVNEILDIILSKLEGVVTNDGGLFLVVLNAAILLNLLTYVVSGLIFYLVVRKAIRKESERQVKENNLMYAAVAHDLKTPLTSISGFAKALEEDKVPEEEKKEILGIIAKKRADE